MATGDQILDHTLTTNFGLRKPNKGATGNATAFGEDLDFLDTKLYELVTEAAKADSIVKANVSITDNGGTLPEAGIDDYALVFDADIDVGSATLVDDNPTITNTSITTTDLADGNYTIFYLKSVNSELSITILKMLKLVVELKNLLEAHKIDPSGHQNLSFTVMYGQIADSQIPDSIARLNQVPSVTGATGSFTTTDGKTIEVQNGLVKSISP